jgi:multimeric flavodoxin WrbA
MKIVGIESSSTPQGNTAVLVREILSAARGVGAETEEIHLAEWNLGYCTGCFQCTAHGRCPLPDGFEEIRRKVYGADGIVIGSPTYGQRPNALMKNLLDRLGMYTVYTSSLAGKYIVGVSTAGAMGADKVAKDLTGIVNGMFGGGYASGTLGVARGWARVEQMPEALEQARALGRRLVEDISQRRSYPVQRLLDRAVTAFFVRPMIRKNVLDHREEEMKAVYENLVARGLMQPAGPSGSRLQGV